MSNVKIRLASALLLSFAASVGLTAVPSGPARAADNCITEPKTEAPQGKHWYYRVEHGTARHCWYTRGKDEASARTPGAEPVAAAKPALSATGSAPPRSLADAHAELASKVRSEDDSAAPVRSVWPNPPTTSSVAAPPAPATPGDGAGANAPTTSADSELTSRWPQASAPPATTNAAPPAAPTVADAQADETTTTNSVAANPPQASAPPPRKVGSLQKLALVAFGALALAGICGSLVYRLAGARWRRRRQERWPQEQPAAPSLADEARGAPWVAPELSSTVPHEHAGQEGHLDAGHVDALADGGEFGKHRDSFEKIEDFLARLTKQLHDELETPRSTELEDPRPR